MNLYRGQILGAVSVVFAVLAGLCGWLYFDVLRFRHDEVGVFCLFMAGAISAIIALVLAGQSYIWWVPKWERIEKRTGHIPGEGRKTWARSKGPLEAEPRSGHEPYAPR